MKKPSPAKKGRTATFALLAILVVLLDQATKFLAVRGLSPREVISLPGPFELRLVFNPGGAYGILSGKGTYLIVFSLLALAAVFIFFYRGRDLVTLGLLFGGITSTLIDRVRLGYVIDFFHIRLPPFNLLFQVFNLADCAIFFGLLILFYRTLVNPRPA